MEDLDKQSYGEDEKDPTAEYGSEKTEATSVQNEEVQENGFTRVGG